MYRRILLPLRRFRSSTRRRLVLHHLTRPRPSIGGVQDRTLFLRFLTRALPVIGEGSMAAQSGPRRGAGWSGGSQPRWSSRQVRRAGAPDAVALDEHAKAALAALGRGAVCAHARDDDGVGHA